MQIGIIGSGHIGGTLARLWAGTGHQVAISNSRGPQSLASLVKEIGHEARAATIEEAAGFGEVVLVAIPFGKYTTLPFDRLAGKVVIDAMNYYPGRDGQVEMGELTSSELVARQLPAGRLVKAFNTMYFETLGSQGKPGAPAEERLVIFLAGDDRQAKEVVAGLIRQIGFSPIDTGSLHEGGRKQQPGSAIYNRPMQPAAAQAALAAA